MAGLRTEYPFVLPKGYVDADGTLHREGTMRLATARDELEPLADPKVKGPDDPYLTVIVLARVITGLGSLTRLSARDVEGLFAADLAHLQDVYSIVNYGSAADVERLLAGRHAAAGTAPLGSAAAPAAPVPAPAPSPVAPSPAAPAAAGFAAEAPAVGAVTGFDGGDDPDLEELELPQRPPRRARIEEVGRSIGRPGGPR